MRFRGRRLSFMRDESVKAKRKHAAPCQHSFVHAARLSCSYVLVCGAAHAPPARRAPPLGPRGTPSIRSLSGAVCVLLPSSARRTAPPAPCYPTRSSSTALGTSWYPIHPRVERSCLRPVAPIRVSSGTICALLLHPLCEHALDGGVLLLGNGKLAAILQGHLAAGHVAHKSGVDQVTCMAANKEVAVALGDRGERLNRLTGTVFCVNQRMGAFALYI